MTGTDPTWTYYSGSRPYPDRLDVATRQDVAALRTELRALRSEIFKVSLSLESAKVRENFRAEFRLHNARLAALTIIIFTLYFTLMFTALLASR